MLWRSRQSIWGTCPPVPAGASRVLDSYFEQRAAEFPSHPAPRFGSLAAVALAPAGAAPGVDNEPYELYQVGARFVANLLGQALYAADSSDADFLRVVGASVDLLIWIPKKLAPRVAGDMRPLQLPTCFRRLGGAALAEVAGPVLERQFSPRQAAVRGGTAARTSLRRTH